MAADDTDKLEIFGRGTSRTMRPVWMAVEYGLQFELHPVDPRSGETRTEAYLKLNPKHKVPTLRHGAFVLTESAAMLGYMQETFQAPAGFFVPADAYERARVDEWCHFVMTELDAHTLYVMRRHGDLSQIYGEAPVAVASARKYHAHQLKMVAPQLEAGGDFLLGERLCIADILLMTCLEWATRYEVPLPEVFADYRVRLRTRPGYRQAYAINFPDRVFEDTD